MQLILIAFDHLDIDDSSFSSELGTEILRLKLADQSLSLDTVFVKGILSETEDIRIAERLSELDASNFDEAELRKRRNDVLNQRFDLRSGQQCIRDLFICLEENAVNWPDITCHFNFTIEHSTLCCNCQYEIKTETDQLYLELSVPENNSDLYTAIEDFFNTSNLVTRFCEESCKKVVQAEKRHQLKTREEASLITVILSRASGTADNHFLNENIVNAIHDVFIRYLS